MSTNPAVPKEVPEDADRSSTSTVRGDVFNPVANHQRVMSGDPAGMTNKGFRKQDTQISHLEGQTRPRHRRGDTGDGRHILQEEEAPEVLGFAWSTRKKWTTLTVIFIVQCSMNYNAAVYANGTTFLQEKFDISAQAARVGQMIFLVSYAFGCEVSCIPWNWPIFHR